MPVQLHCQLTSQEPHSALFSCGVEPEISLFLLLRFLSCSPCHCGGSLLYHSADLTQPLHSQLRLGNEAHCTSLYTCSMLKCLSTTAHIYILGRAGRLCVYASICGSKPLVGSPEHRLKKAGMGSETASRANTSPRLQVETIPD